MKNRLIACSISRPVQELLFASGRVEPEWSVLAVFQRACDLVNPDGNIVALVTPQVGDGPFNVVVCGSAGVFEGVDLETPVSLVGKSLRLGRLEVALHGSPVWEPRPDWNALRERRTVIAEQLPCLWEIACRHAPMESLTEPPRAAAHALRAGWSGDLDQLAQGAAQLAGLGPGLTPAGDDFLVGAMLWAWLAHPDPAAFCRVVAETAAPRTTTLSAAWLRAAAEGQCSASWHQLLAALTSGKGMEPAVQGVLARGATSGADTLAGFGWVPAGCFPWAHLQVGGERRCKLFH